ncbi:MAG: hypothetical protein OXG84_12575 [Chloroflexi bacterium]|nr:hypothetical protein [Chloroflexota bacterium]
MYLGKENSAMDGPKLKPAPPEDIVADDDDREPTKEEIMDDIRQGLRDVLAGEQGMPALEGLEALRRRIYHDTEIR